MNRQRAGSHARRELVVAVVHAVACSLGEDVVIPPLADPLLDDAEVAAEVVAAAGYHAVLPLLWAAVERCGTADALREAVHQAYLPFVARGLRLQYLLKIACQELAAAGVQFAIYKGEALATGYYADPGHRVYGDVDVLVRAADLTTVDAALRRVGLRGATWQQKPDGYAENEYLLPGFGMIDLHWHLMREPAVRRGFAIDPAAMLGRTRLLPMHGFDVPVLDDADMLIAVATHACFDGAYLLGWFVDLARIMRSQDLDWRVVRQRCAETRTALPVQIMLDRTAQAIGVHQPGPPLATGTWRQLLRGLSTARPVQRTFRQAGRGGVVYRATRASTIPSLSALWRIVVSEGVIPLLTDPNHRWRRRRGERA